MPSSWGLRVSIRRLAWAALAVAALGLGACSPEAGRTRGGGPGADVGNRDYPLPEMHGVRDPAFKTPLVGQAVRK